jgi:hypothetical protein
MSILFSGDFHGNAMNELNLIREDILLEKYGQEKYSSIKYHIILGDAGFMWWNNKAEDLYSY